jgi:hypothetical protein
MLTNASCGHQHCHRATPRESDVEDRGRIRRAGREEEEERERDKRIEGGVEEGKRLDLNVHSKNHRIHNLYK